MRIAIAFLAASLCCAWGQEIKLPPGIEKLAAKAQEATEVNLDSNMLQMATKFLSEKDPDQAKARKIASGLKSVVVRAFEFSKDSDYTAADVDSLRAPLQGWSKIVSVKSKGESTDVYFKPAAAGQIGGLVVISAEPRELTYVQIDGTLSPDDIADLGGQFGIPQIPGVSGVKITPRGGGKKDEE
jgi:hypothetical protein